MNTSATSDNPFAAVDWVPTHAQIEAIFEREQQGALEASTEPSIVDWEQVSRRVAQRPPRPNLVPSFLMPEPWQQQIVGMNDPEDFRQHIQTVWGCDFPTQPEKAAAPPRESGAMKETTGNLWDTECPWIAITTNMFVSRNGFAIMGRGCAKELVDRCPEAPGRLGSLNQHVANPVKIFATWNGKQIVNFPVKPRHVIADQDLSNIVPHMRGKFARGQFVPGWAAMADPELIAKSAKRLRLLVDEYHPLSADPVVAVPRPGCGAGGLKWEDVKPLLEPFFDHRFLIYSPK